MDKFDPYKHKEHYFNWKECSKKNGIENVSPENLKLILKYLEDMETGFNVSSKSVKGSRSFIRLNTLRIKMIFFAKKFKELYNVSKVQDIKEEQLVSFFHKMRNGEIKKEQGKGNYLSVDTYVKVFKAFWHWYQKINKKQGIEIPEITSDLDTSREKSKWVYLDENKIRRLTDKAKYEYKVLIWFLFDSGIRAPTELMNLKVSDFYFDKDSYEVEIRTETSKTFGRRIKLMLSGPLVKDYINESKLDKDSFVFTFRPETANKYLKRLAVGVLGTGRSPAGGEYNKLSLYDFRHSSCCYWLPRYKSESALKYRFGWKKSEEIHYYSELLGMKDTIQEEDLLINATKTEIQVRLERTEQENSILKEKMGFQDKQMKQIQELVTNISRKLTERGCK